MNSLVVTVRLKGVRKLMRQLRRIRRKVERAGDRDLNLTVEVAQKR